MTRSQPRGEVYFSIDIEADGPSPGLNNLLSLGAAAYTLDKRVLGTFSCNLDLLPDAKPDAKTMREFWAKNQAAWQAARFDPTPPRDAIPEFARWVREISGRDKPLFVGFPAAFDFKFVDYYLRRFTGDSPFGTSAVIDMKTLAWSYLGGPFGDVTKRNFPRRWFDPAKHTHIALEDAIEQGALFVNMLRDLRGMPPIGPVDFAEAYPSRALR